MIRPLRDRHRWLVPLVGLVTALVIASAYAAHRAAARDPLVRGSRHRASVGRPIAEPATTQATEPRP